MIAAIYARKSTEQTGVADEAKSVTRQIEHATAYATRKGWVVADEYVFVDDGISGAEFAKRPAFVRLMNSLKPRPPFQVLVMSEESRLGREQIEVSFALKQLIQADVRVFSYLTDSERTLNSAVEKAMLALQTMADEMEREKARLRVTEAMIRKVRQGYVGGGRVFGYDNVEVTGPDGRRSHVDRRINPAEAATVVRMYELYAGGTGHSTIAHLLNVDGSTSPRPQQGRPKGWCASSVREVIHRSLYRGLITYNKTAKRDKWGRTKVAPRRRQEWLEVPRPDLRIVPEALAAAVDGRLAAMRSRTARQHDGRLIGRPAGESAKYLLTGLIRCGICGGSFEALGSSFRGKRFVYGCATHRRKGAVVCPNGMTVRMADAEDAVLASVKKWILNPAVVTRALAITEDTRRRDHAPERQAVVETELAAIQRAIARLTEAIATGGDLLPLVTALDTQEQRRKDLEARLDALRKPPATADAAAMRRQLLRYVDDWRGFLDANVQQAQQALRQLIAGRLTFVPNATENCYDFNGIGTVRPLLSKVSTKTGVPEGSTKRWGEISKAELPKGNFTRFGK